MRPTKSVTSLLVAGAATAVLLAMAPAAGAAPAPVMHGRLDRLTSVVQTTEAPYGDPVPIHVVLVSGTITGCTPGQYFTAFTTLEQDGVRLSEASGGNGSSDAVCGADGTVRIQHIVWSPYVGGLPHAGRALATLHAEDPYGGGVLVDVRRWVTVPGAHHRCHGRGGRS